MKKYLTTLCITALTMFSLNTPKAHSGLIIGSMEGCWDGCEGMVGVSIFVGGWGTTIAGAFIKPAILVTTGASLMILNENGDDQIKNLLQDAFPFIESQEVLEELALETYKKINQDQKVLTNKEEIILDRANVLDILGVTDLSQKEINFVLNALTK